MKKYQLMAPGPTPVPSEVLLAMAQPIIHHRTPQYEALFIEVRAALKKLFQTTAEVIPLVQGPERDHFDHDADQERGRQRERDAEHERSCPFRERGRQVRADHRAYPAMAAAARS